MIVFFNYSNESATATNCWSTGYELDEFVPSYQPPIQAAAFLFYILLGIPLNALIVVLAAKFKDLHQRDFAMTLQVVAADVVFLLCFPFGIYTMLGGSHKLVPTECYVMGFVKMFVNFVRFMMMFVLSLDRFSNVFFPFSYAMYGTKVCIFLSVTVWTLAAAVATVPLTMDCYGYVPNFGFCMIQPYCAVKCKSFTIGIVCVMITLGGIVPTLFYFLMFLKARILAKSNAALTPSSQHSSRPHITFLWLLVTLIGCSAPVTIVLVTFPLLKVKHPNAFWTFFGMSMTAFEAIVVADPS